MAKLRNDVKFISGSIFLIKNAKNGQKNGQQKLEAYFSQPKNPQNDIKLLPGTIF